MSSLSFAVIAAREQKEEVAPQIIFS